MPTASGRQGGLEKQGTIHKCRHALEEGVVADNLMIVLIGRRDKGKGLKMGKIITLTSFRDGSQGGSEKQEAH